jgi:hypothetical protein
MHSFTFFNLMIIIIFAGGLPPVQINLNLVNRVVVLENCGRFPLDMHHLQCSPNTHVLGSNFLGKHLLGNVVVRDNAMVRGGVGVPHNCSQDLFGVAHQLDGVLPQDGHSILSNAQQYLL